MARVEFVISKDAVYYNREKLLIPPPPLSWIKLVTYSDYTDSDSSLSPLIFI
jgi:hypothetical protein